MNRAFRFLLGLATLFMAGSAVAMTAPGLLPGPGDETLWQAEAGASTAGASPILPADARTLARLADANTSSGETPSGTKPSAANRPSEANLKNGDTPVPAESSLQPEANDVPETTATLPNEKGSPRTSASHHGHNDHAERADRAKKAKGRASGDSHPATTISQAPTTTTPSTTTTRPTSNSGLLIPPTRPYDPPNGLKTDEGFRLGLACGDTADQVCPDTSGGSHHYATITYMGHGMPYLYDFAESGHHDHAWWVAGDRESYRCAYAFMYDLHPNPFGGHVRHPDGHFIARATIVRPPGAGYGKVNDSYMAEGQRYYDGTPYKGGTREIPDENCQTTALDEFDYDSFTPQGPDDIRVGLFAADGQIADIRDFTDINPKEGHFEFLSFNGERVTILFILDDIGKVSHVFYYDEMGDGRIAVEVNGQLIGG